MNFLKRLKELENEIKEVLNKDNVKRIGISNSYFEVEFFDKEEKTLKAGSDLKIKKAESDLKIKKAESDLKIKKDYSDTSALDKLYEQPPTKAELDAELEERNRKLREKFSNQGNVIPSDGVVAWAGE